MLIGLTIAPHIMIAIAEASNSSYGLCVVCKGAMVGR